MKIFAIDFDGTIVQDKYPAIGVLQPYARDVINRLHEEGHYIIIWTCRTGDHLTNAVNFLLASGIKFDRVNDHEPNNCLQYGPHARKVFADYYIDDKIVGGFPGWATLDQLIFNTNMFE